MNGFLKRHQEIIDATNEIRANGWVEHSIDCKNWDIVRVMPHLSDGNFLDMGSMGSSMLYNVVRAGFDGLKYGIDIGYSDNPILMSPPDYNVPTEGVRCFKGDLMKTPFENGLFKYITCLSTIEHNVDLHEFSDEVSRLLCRGGRVFITFDYWDPKIGINLEWGGMRWNILCRSEIEEFVSIMAQRSLLVDGDIDWDIDEAVINPGYYSGGTVSYTFGFLTFVKQ